MKPNHKQGVNESHAHGVKNFRQRLFCYQNCRFIVRGARLPFVRGFLGGSGRDKIITKEITGNTTARLDRPLLELRNGIPLCPMTSGSAAAMAPMAAIKDQTMVFMEKVLARFESLERCANSASSAGPNGRGAPALTSPPPQSMPEIAVVEMSNARSVLWE